MTMTTLATIVGGLITIGIAAAGVISGLKKKREREQQEAEMRRKENEARIKALERQASTPVLSNFATQNQPTPVIPQPTSIAVHHYVHNDSQQGSYYSNPYSNYPQPNYNTPAPNAYYINPPAPTINYNYGYGYHSSEPVWKGERSFGNGGGYNSYSSGRCNPYSSCSSPYKYAYA